VSAARRSQHGTTHPGRSVAIKARQLESKLRAADLGLQTSDARGPRKNDEAYNARMAALYREVVLKEKPVQSHDGFIPLVRPRSRGLRGRRLRSQWLGIKSSIRAPSFGRAAFRRPSSFCRSISARSLSLASGKCATLRMGTRLRFLAICRSLPGSSATG
jgi:hypothetical protein